MILGFLKHCKALSTEKYRPYINILLSLLLRWRRSKKSTSRSQLHVQDPSFRRITYYCFRQGSICDSKIIFHFATTFFSAPCVLKNFWKGKSTRILACRWEGSLDQDSS